MRLRVTGDSSRVHGQTWQHPTAAAVPERVWPDSSDGCPGEGAGAVWCCERLPLLLLLLGLVVFLPVFMCLLKVSPLVEEMGDHKDVKKFFRTQDDVLALYSRSAAAASSLR